MGRFTQADTIVPDVLDPQSWNRYAYTLNNPVRYTDPTGHMISDEDTGGSPPPPPTPTPTPTLTPTPTPTPTPTDVPTLPATSNEPQLPDRNDNGGKQHEGICGIDPSETECNPYKKAIEVAKGLCESSTPPCYVEETWILVDVVGNSNSKNFTLLVQQSLNAYASQGLDLALIVDQGINNPLELENHPEYGLVSQKTALNHNWVTAGFLQEIGVDSTHIANYETLLLMRHVERNPVALFNSAFSCITNPVCAQDK